MTTDVLSITHCDEEGTLIEGTRRGDGAGDVLRGQGWRWSSTLGSWYVRGSRGHLPRRDLIDRTAQALRNAGFGVSVTIDATPADPAVLDRQRRERAAARAEQLSARAAAAERSSEAHWVAGKQISDGIPLGQPILVGHHSERRHRRDLDRINMHSRKASEASEAAAELTRRAAAAEVGARPDSKETLGNRIATLAAEVRKTERTLAKVSDPAGPAADHWREKLDRDQAHLEYARGEWAERVACGEFVEYGPTMVKAGDAVRIGNRRWARVAKANKASCSLETGHGWTDRVPWHKITGHRSATVEAEDASA